MSFSLCHARKMFGAALLASAPIPAAVAADADLQQMRDEIRALKSEYETRIHALEQRLERAERANAPPPQAQAPAVATPEPSASAFNPKISLILDGGYADYGDDHEEPEVPGFVLGDETEPRKKGLSIGETELAIEANVDQSFHAWTTLAVSPEEGEIGVEEAYIDTLNLPAGFAVKFGRFFSDIGYQNRQHAHAWEFADAPLVYRTLLGTRLGDDGIQLRWVAPTDTFFEVGTELLRGDAFPAGGDGRNGIKAITGFAHVGGDAGISGSWRLGLSHLRADANRRPTGDEDDGTLVTFDGKSDLTILDGVYKWSPNGNATVRNAVIQGEYFFRREHGDLVFDPDGVADASRYRGDQQGFYLQGIYQFMPRWRVGLRYDRLFADNDVDDAVADTPLALIADDGGRDPDRWSLMTDYSNSEFSRFRLQFSLDDSRPGHDEDHQVFLQYIFSLGPHPAHQF